MHRRYNPASDKHCALRMLVQANSMICLPDMFAGSMDTTQGCTFKLCSCSQLLEVHGLLEGPDMRKAEEDDAWESMAYLAL